MNSNVCRRHMRCATATASAIAILAVHAAAAMAGEQVVTIRQQVSTAGFELSSATDARQLYSRLRHAAKSVCGHAGRIDLAPESSPEGCAEKALADAVRRTHAPLLTQAWLATHTIEEARASGIELPPEMASR